MKQTPTSADTKNRKPKRNHRMTESKTTLIKIKRKQMTMLYLKEDTRMKREIELERCLCV